MSEEEKQPLVLTKKDVAIILLSRRFAAQVNELFESLKMQDVERNPYAELSDVDKTAVMMDAAMMLIGQTGGMALAQTESPGEQDKIYAHIHNNMKKHVEACRKAFLSMKEDKHEPSKS